MSGGALCLLHDVQSIFKCRFRVVVPDGGVNALPPTTERGMLVTAALAGASVAAIMVWQSFAEVPSSWLWFALRWLVLLLPYAVLLGLVAHRDGAWTLGYASGIAWTAFAVVLAFLVVPVDCWVSTFFCLVELDPLLGPLSLLVLCAHAALGVTTRRRRLQLRTGSIRQRLPGATLGVAAWLGAIAGAVAIEAHALYRPFEEPGGLPRATRLWSMDVAGTDSASSVFSIEVGDSLVLIETVHYDRESPTRRRHVMSAANGSMRSWSTVGAAAPTDIYRHACPAGVQFTHEGPYTVIQRADGSKTRHRRLPGAVLAVDGRLYGTFDVGRERPRRRFYEVDDALRPTRRITELQPGSYVKCTLVDRGRLYVLGGRPPSGGLWLAAFDAPTR